MVIPLHVELKVHLAVPDVSGALKPPCVLQLDEGTVQAFPADFVRPQWVSEPLRAFLVPRMTRQHPPTPQ